MDGQMKINGDKVRALREQKSWSQEHLARASGLSGRTVQRVEVEGIASAETRLGLAAALGIPVTELLTESSSAIPVSGIVQRLPLWGWLGWGIGIACLIATVGYGFRHGVFQLDQVLANILPWFAIAGIGLGVVAARASKHREPNAKD